MTKELAPKIRILNPDNVNLTPLAQEIDSLEQDVKNHNKKYAYFATSAKDMNDQSFQLLKNASEFTDTSNLVSNTVAQTIREVRKLADSFKTSESCKKDFCKS